MGTVLKLLGIAFATFVASVSARAVDRLPTVNVVIDIDWTLTSEISTTEDIAAYAADGRLIEVEGKFYHVTNGAGEAIRRILDFNRRLGYEYVQISFFSGGHRKRNETLLSRITVDPDAKSSALDIAKKVLSFENLGDLRPDLAADSHEIPFAERYEKNLVTHFEALERTIAIDDSAKFFKGDQAKSLLWIGETYLHFPTYADALMSRAANPTKKYLPPDFSAWVTDQNRLLIALLQVEYALESEISAANGGPTARKIPFRDRLQAIHAKFSKQELFSRLKSIYPSRVLNYCPSILLNAPKTTP